MSEIRPPPKKMVSRNVAVALGILCILLIALIAYFSVTGISAQNSYNNLQNQNNQLQAWLEGNETLLIQTQTWLTGNITAYNSLQSTYNSYVGDHSYTNVQYQNLQNQITSLNAQITSLQSQVNALTNIVNLANSTVWVSDEPINQGAGAYTTWTFSATYAGYVSVLIQSSTVSGTHVEVIYSSHGVNFNQEITVSAGNSAVFPLLPSSDITVGVGNGNVFGSASETVTVTYYY